MSTRASLTATGAALAAIFLLGASGAASARVYVGINIGVAPPPVRAEVVGVAPVRGYVWTAGYWNWVGGRYLWVPGRWVAPRAGFFWVQPHWAHGARGWRFARGHWARR
jgi:WXXGXW repeat (2 copies)